MDYPSDFKSYRPKNLSKISIYGWDMNLYEETTEYGHFEGFS